MSASRDVALRLTLKDGRSVYREGEIIPLELAFTSTTKKKYVADTRSYDRSGRLNLEHFCVSPDGRDPLEDYYRSGIWLVFVGGGLSSGDHVLSRVPYIINPELNEWKLLPPASYTLRVVSDRVGAVAHDAARIGGEPISVISNTVSFRVVEATPEWQAEQLTTAVAMLDVPHSMDDPRFPDHQTDHAARVLRFLGSEAATRELARRFWALNDQPHGWDFKFGLVGSPYRAAAMEGLSAAIEDPRHPVTRDLIEALALLEIQSKPEYKLPPYDPSMKDEWEEQQKAKVAAYDKIVGELLKRVVVAVDKKQGQAHAITTNTLREEKEKRESDPKEVPLWPPAELWADMGLTEKSAVIILIAVPICLTGILVRRWIKRTRPVN